MSIFDHLNQAQKEAVLHKEGPLLVIAGAGAGKTRTIAYRIINLVQNGTRPENILAITFTNKAAKEMRERIESLVREQGLQGLPFISTFHSLGVYLLRNHAGVLGLSRYFSIYDRDESISKIKQAMRSLNVDEKRYEPKKILGAISKHKGNGMSLKNFHGAQSHDFYPKMIASIWKKYEEILTKEQALDFDDLLLKTVELFQKDAELLSHYQNLWKYIHIDEYQDTNTIQYSLTRLLAGHQNICVVGDMDQSIYSWRGADFTNILNFEKDYPGATTVMLEQNYRSTKNILDAANSIIRKNKNRREKNLFTENTTGDKITLMSGGTEGDEARFIVDTCRDLIRQGTEPEEIAVLYRANFQSRVLEEAFLRGGVSYKVLGTRFYERKEIKDIMSFVRLALNSNDAESLKRIINVPPRGIGTVTLEKILSGKEEELPTKMKEKIADFRKNLNDIADQTKILVPSELIKFIIDKTGLSGLEHGDEDEKERFENIKEFVSLASKYDSLTPEAGLLALVSETALVSDQDSLIDKKRGVKMMTVHAAKGLEFKVVFVTGLEENLFPHAPMDRTEARDEEEERRLFYVAITRAREKLYLTYAQMRTIFGSRQMTLPSQFLNDVDESLISAESEEADDYTTNYIDF